MPAPYTDFLFTPVGNSLTPWIGVYVRYVSNNTSTAYISTAPTTSSGKFTFTTIPGDNYTTYTGPTAGGPWTGTGDTSATVPYVAGDDAALKSVTTQSSSPYTPISPTGSSALYGHKFTFAPAGGTTDDGANFQTLIDAVPANSIIEFQPGTYLFNTSVRPRSFQTYYAARGTVTIKRTVAGDCFVAAGATAGTLTQTSWIGLNFDLTNTAWSSINIAGSDAAGQLSDILIRDCQFKNPSLTWMIQIAYTIVDPTVPVSKNKRIRIEDCMDDATGQTFTLENLIITNCEDVVISGNSFLNAPSTLNSHVSVYGYNRNVRFIGNYSVNWNSTRCFYAQQSDNILIQGDQYRTTNDKSAITIFECQDVTIVSCAGTLPAAGAGSHVNIFDHGGATFDGHTNLYNQSSRIKVQSGNWQGGATVCNLNVSNIQGQTDIVVEGNLVTPFRQLFNIQSMPASPSASIKRISIQNNHIASHSGFSGGVGCVEIAGNASATLGGVSGVVIQNNTFAASAAGGTGTDIEILNKADDITITGNRHLGSTTPIVGTGVATNMRAWDNPGADPNAIGPIGVGSVMTRKTTPTYSASITPVASDSGWQTITVTNGTAFTINAPTSPPAATGSQELSIEILNSSGGAMGVITWNAAFVFQALVWANPANTKKRFVTFRWNGVNWIANALATADY